MINDHVGLLTEIERDWAGAALTGSLLGRNLNTGEQLGFGSGQPWVLASVAKLPIALVIHDAFERGELDPAEPYDIAPDAGRTGSTGVAIFRHPSRIAAEDLAQLSLAVSDNVATDLVMDRLGPAEISARLAGLGLPDIIIRHSMRSIFGTSNAVSELGVGLAAAARRGDGSHPIDVLDPHRANVGTPLALVDLLDRLWTDRIASPAVCARVRTALGHQRTRHRLAVELAGDGVRVASKTGTFLDLRHEVGVVEIGSDRIAVAAFTRSAAPAEEQLEADFAIGHAARLLVEALRL